MNYRLTPSDLTYLYDGCKHCFTLKVRHGISQPSIQLPRMFSMIGELQKNYYSGKRTEHFCPSLPPGAVEYGEKWVRSAPVEVPGRSSTCFINGRFDIVVKFDDGSYAVMDFKTAAPNERKSNMYARQLHAYTLALENPAPGKLELKPITKLGLLYYTPDDCKLIDPSRQVLEGSMQWVEIVRDDQRFLSFLSDIIGVLDGDMPEPQICAKCAHCVSGLTCEVGGWGSAMCTACPCSCCAWCKYQITIGELGLSAMRAADDSSSKGDGLQCPTCKAPMVRKHGRRGEFWSCSKYPSCYGTRNISQN